jgi:hypothetical protein
MEKREVDREEPAATRLCAAPIPRYPLATFAVHHTSSQSAQNRSGTEITAIVRFLVLFLSVCLSTAFFSQYVCLVYLPKDFDLKIVGKLKNWTPPVQGVELEDSMHVHKQVIENGCEFDVFVGSSLVDMYAKCGSMEDAQSVQQDAVSRCSHLECHGIGTCEMQPRAEGTGTIWTNATGWCATRLCFFCGGAECMC